MLDKNIHMLVSASFVELQTAKAGLICSNCLLDNFSCPLVFFDRFPMQSHTEVLDKSNRWAGVLLLSKYARNDHNNSRRWVETFHLLLGSLLTQFESLFNTIRLHLCGISCGPTMECPNQQTNEGGPMYTHGFRSDVCLFTRFTTSH